MTSDFRFVALPVENFVRLFSMNDAELAAHGAKRLVVDETPGYPCRVSLLDTPIGERVLLAPFAHHEVDSPYRAAGPIFVRETAQTAKPEINEVPLMFHHRLLSVRAYDDAGMMRGARVVEGRALKEAIQDFFANTELQ